MGYFRSAKIIPATLGKSPGCEIFMLKMENWGALLIQAEAAVEQEGQVSEQSWVALRSFFGEQWDCSGTWVTAIKRFRWLWLSST